MAQRVLVTGHTGFIGSSLFKYHQIMDDDVKGISKSTGTDVRSSELDVKNFDLIYHCASTVNDYNFLSGDSLDIDTNCLGTHRLLEALRRTNPWAKLVYVSSFFANGDPPYLPVTEQTPCYPKGLYGASKLFCENMCNSYAKTFNMDITIARITNVYGPGNEKASMRTSAFNWMLKQIANDNAVSLYDGGRVKRDYIFITDVVAALELLGEKGLKGETYFISSGRGVSFKDMMLTAKKAAHCGRTRYVDIPDFHSRVGIQDFWASHDKLGELGWEPRIALEDGIRYTIQYYQKQQLKNG